MQALVEKFLKLRLEYRIAVIVISAHALVLTGFSFSKKISTGETLGSVVSASLIEGTSHQEKRPSKVSSEPVTKPTPEKQVTLTASSNSSVTSTHSPAETTLSQSSVGGSRNEGKTVQLSQAQCLVPEPIYPSIARRMGEQGKTLIRIMINEQGQISQASLAQSSGLPRLDQAALDAAQKVRCKPFVESGVAIKVTAIQPYIFRLE